MTTLAATDEGSAEGRSGAGVDRSGGMRAAAAPPRNRMGIALSALGGFFVATYLLFAKLGLTGPIVCGVGDCGRVQASRWAEILGVPVAAWGVIGYGLLFATAMAGLRPAGIADRRIAAALVAFAAVAFGFSAYLTALEAFVIRAWCQWCVVSAGLAALIFLLALMELPRLTRSD